MYDIGVGKPPLSAQPRSYDTQRIHRFQKVKSFSKQSRNQGISMVLPVATPFAPDGVDIPGRSLSSS